MLGVACPVDELACPVDYAGRRRIGHGVTASASGTATLRLVEFPRLGEEPGWKHRGHLWLDRCFGQGRRGGRAEMA